RRDHQDQDVRIALHELLDALAAVHLGHGQVHGHDGRPQLLVQLERLAAVAGCTDELDARQVLHALDAPADDVGVIHDHQPVRHRLAHATDAAEPSASCGSRTLKRVYSPAAEATSIRPPASRTRVLTASRPTP